MKILQLCLRVPNPPRDGGAIAMYNITKALWHHQVEVHVLAINTPKHFVDPAQMDEQYKIKSQFDFVNVNTELKPVAALNHLIKNESYQISRFYCKVFEKKLLEKLKQNKYDVVQLESLFMAPYIPAIRQFSNAKVALRAHNVEHVVWKRLARNEKNPITKWYLKKLTKQLRKYELETLQQLDAIVAISNDDLNYFKSVNQKLKSIVFPLSIDVEDYPFQLTEKPPSTVFHLGSMDWFPNIEAADWFLDNVCSELVKRLPNIKIYLAGKDMPSRILNKHSKLLFVSGRVNNPVDYMSDKDIMVVPLFSGSGMRVKIIEGMALGKVVVSTTLGAEGISCKHNVNIIIADTAEEFVDSIENLISNPEKYQLIAENARELVANHYGNFTLGEKLADFYHALIQQKTATANPL